MNDLRQHVETHNLRNAVSTLKRLVENLKNGYRFDDHLATEKIEAVDQAVRRLEYFTVSALPPKKNG